MSFSDGSNIADCLRPLSMQEIALASSTTLFGRADKRNRSHMLTTVAYLPEREQQLIRCAASSKRVHPIGDDQEGRLPKRCKLETMDMEEVTTGLQTSKNTSVVDAAEEEIGPFSAEQEFLRAPKGEVINRCISNFIDRTSNEALMRQICICCARTVWRHETTVYKVDNIPNPKLLKPFEAHPAHILTNGMLLHLKAVKKCEGGEEGSLCNPCLRDLKARKTPKFSLANGMWIGDIPPELAALTITERILIAKYFPAAYIVKLFPKKKGARHWTSEKFNSGVRGNVSTYRLNTADIVAMVDTNVYPPPASILAAVVGVTIIGPKGLPEKSLQGLLKVRRARLWAAYVWLKANNLVYADITISQKMLEQYPENDIPPEVLGVIKYSDDVEQLERERAGYVIEDDDNIAKGDNIVPSMGGMCLTIVTLQKKWIQKLYTGIVDVDDPDNELMDSVTGE